jgi:hypothetical protein
MTDKKRCVRCERDIDAYARLCPFCNWDQSETPPPVIAQPAPVADYVPPEERNTRRIILGGVGGALLLIVAFVLGSRIHGANPEETAAKTGGSLVSQTAGPAPAKANLGGPQANVALEPVGNNQPLVEQPITSAPLPTTTNGVPDEYQRSDATAVSSAEYQQLAARAKAEKQQSALTDPRLLTAPVYRKPRPRPVEEQSAAAPVTQQLQGSRTPPKAESIWFPEIYVDQETTVNVTLLVGADGRVHSVSIDGVVPGQTAKLIAAIHSWKFRPATENGVPVAAPFSTAVSFHANE